jgi:hypothetical protein
MSRDKNPTNQVEKWLKVESNQCIIKTNEEVINGSVRGGGEKPMMMKKNGCVKKETIK